MWKKIVSTVMDLVAWAESELKDKTGAEKKALVIEQLIKSINWPYVPDLFETPIERIVYGYLIDRGCSWFNFLGDGNFAELELSGEQKEKVAAMIETAPEEILAPELLEDETVDAKLTALYAKYTG
jgi:hypothetical protein